MSRSPLSPSQRDTASLSRYTPLPLHHDTLRTHQCHVHQLQCQLHRCYEQQKWMKEYVDGMVMEKVEVERELEVVKEAKQEWHTKYLQERTAHDTCQSLLTSEMAKVTELRDRLAQYKHHMMEREREIQRISGEMILMRREMEKLVTVNAALKQQMGDSNPTTPSPSLSIMSPLSTSSTSSSSSLSSLPPLRLSLSLSRPGSRHQSPSSSTPSSPRTSISHKKYSFSSSSGAASPVHREGINMTSHSALLSFVDKLNQQHSSSSASNVSVSIDKATTPVRTPRRDDLLNKFIMPSVPSPSNSNLLPPPPRVSSPQQRDHHRSDSMGSSGSSSSNNSTPSASPCASSITPRARLSFLSIQDDNDDALTVHPEEEDCDTDGLAGRGHLSVMLPPSTSTSSPSPPHDDDTDPSTSLSPSTPTTVTSPTPHPHLAFSLDVMTDDNVKCVHLSPMSSATSSLASSPTSDSPYVLSPALSDSSIDDDDVDVHKVQPVSIIVPTMVSSD